jgi:hypothetical protein
MCQNFVSLGQTEKKDWKNAKGEMQKMWKAYKEFI